MWPAGLADTQRLLLSHTDQFTPDLDAQDGALQLGGQQKADHVSDDAPKSERVGIAWQLPEKVPELTQG